MQHRSAILDSYNELKERGLADDDVILFNPLAQLRRQLQEEEKEDLFKYDPASVEFQEAEEALQSLDAEFGEVVDDDQDLKAKRERQEEIEFHQHQIKQKQEMKKRRKRRQRHRPTDSTDAKPAESNQTNNSKQQQQNQQAGPSTAQSAEGVTTEWAFQDHSGIDNDRACRGNRQLFSLQMRARYASLHAHVLEMLKEGAKGADADANKLKISSVQAFGKESVDECKTQQQQDEADEKLVDEVARVKGRSNPLTQAASESDPSYMRSSAQSVLSAPPSMVLRSSSSISASTFSHAKHSMSMSIRDMSASSAAAGAGGAAAAAAREQQQQHQNLFGPLPSVSTIMQQLVIPPASIQEQHELDREHERQQRRRYNQLVIIFDRCVVWAMKRNVVSLEEEQRLREKRDNVSVRAALVDLHDALKEIRANSPLGSRVGGGNRGATTVNEDGDEDGDEYGGGDGTSSISREARAKLCMEKEAIRIYTNLHAALVALGIVNPELSELQVNRAAGAKVARAVSRQGALSATMAAAATMRRTGGGAGATLQANEDGEATLAIPVSPSEQQQQEQSSSEAIKAQERSKKMSSLYHKIATGDKESSSSTSGGFSGKNMTSGTAGSASMRISPTASSASMRHTLSSGSRSRTMRHSQRTDSPRAGAGSQSPPGTPPGVAAERRKTDDALEVLRRRMEEQEKEKQWEDVLRLYSDGPSSSSPASKHGSPHSAKWHVTGKHTSMEKGFGSASKVFSPSPSSSSSRKRRRGGGRKKPATGGAGGGVSNASFSSRRGRSGAASTSSAGTSPSTSVSPSRRRPGSGSVRIPQTLAAEAKTKIEHDQQQEEEDKEHDGSVRWYFATQNDEEQQRQHQKKNSSVLGKGQQQNIPLAAPVVSVTEIISNLAPYARVIEVTFLEPKKLHTVPTSSLTDDQPPDVPQVAQTFSLRGLQGPEIAKRLAQGDNVLGSRGYATVIPHDDLSRSLLQSALNKDAATSLQSRTDPSKLHVLDSDRRSSTAAAFLLGQQQQHYNNNNNSSAEKHYHHRRKESCESTSSQQPTGGSESSGESGSESVAPSSSAAGGASAAAGSAAGVHRLVPVVPNPKASLAQRRLQQLSGPLRFGGSIIFAAPQNVADLTGAKEFLRDHYAVPLAVAEKLVDDTVLCDLFPKSDPQTVLLSPTQEKQAVVALKDDWETTLVSPQKQQHHQTHPPAQATFDSPFNNSSFARGSPTSRTENTSSAAAAAAAAGRRDQQQHQQQQPATTGADSKPQTTAEQQQQQQQTTTAKAGSHSPPLVEHTPVPSSATTMQHPADDQERPASSSPRGGRPSSSSPRAAAASLIGQAKRLSTSSQPQWNQPYEPQQTNSSIDSDRTRHVPPVSSSSSSGWHQQHQQQEHGFDAANPPPPPTTNIVTQGTAVFSDDERSPPAPQQSKQTPQQHQQSHAAVSTPAAKTPTSSLPQSQQRRHLAARQLVHQSYDLQPEQSASAVVGSADPLPRPPPVAVFPTIAERQHDHLHRHINRMVHNERSLTNMPVPNRVYRVVCEMPYCVGIDETSPFEHSGETSCLNDRVLNEREEEEAKRVKERKRPARGARSLAGRGVVSSFLAKQTLQRSRFGAQQQNGAEFDGDDGSGEEEGETTAVAVATGNEHVGVHESSWVPSNALPPPVRLPRPPAEAKPSFLPPPGSVARGFADDVVPNPGTANLPATARLSRELKRIAERNSELHPPPPPPQKEQQQRDVPPESEATAAAPPLAIEGPPQVQQPLPPVTNRRGSPPSLKEVYRWKPTGRKLAAAAHEQQPRQPLVAATVRAQRRKRSPPAATAGALMELGITQSRLKPDIARHGGFGLAGFAKTN